MTTSPIYKCSPNPADCLCHGEILSELVRYPLDPAKIGESPTAVIEVEYSYVIVLSQSCDLIQDFNGRKQGQPQLPDILFCHIPTAEELRSTPGIASDIWKRIRQNKDERYHFLEKIPPECDLLNKGIPELGVDFKRYFTLPTEEVYHWIQAGRTGRRSVLTTPYLEHLSSRFSYFLSRVALPRDHISE